MVQPYESENGWQPRRAGAELLEWVTVPGTDVALQLMKGAPLQIMRAYAADYNAYVEPLRDADSAAFTPTNSVDTSNHLNGTAMDLNWNSHPFRVSNAGYTPQMIATMRELLDFYEDTMFWAQNWDEPKDAMHHQMGYGTYGNPAVDDFIRRKMRADGYSTFRRGDTWTPVTGELIGEENPMATADDVTRELTGGSEVVLYEGADWPNGELRTGRMRVWLERLAWDLLRAQPGIDTNRNGDNKSGRKTTLRDAVTRILFENTLWTPMLSLAELVTKRGDRQTTHGHALKAASYGDASIRILGRIADKLDVDIDDLLK